MNGVWDMDIFTKGESGPITLASEFEGDVPADFKIVLLDVITHQTYNLLDESSQVILTDYREEFPYHLKAVAGRNAWVDAKVQEILAQLPSEFALHQNYPNPFNPTTTIRFALPKPDKVILVVYDLLGREVAILREGWLDLGEHEVLWNGYDRFGRPLPSGIYFVRFAVLGHNRTIKMVLLK
ncbi:MAG: T9SS type A sorting domain-containing protein [Calditrichaeota bacterium]|nr:T9SS type A sorting domain-containing protein [Calditrichota bacterium]